MRNVAKWRGANNRSVDPNNCLPAVEHSACMPDVAHSACMPDVAHSACMPTVEHSACMPDVAHSACVPTVEHSACMLDVEQSCIHVESNLTHKTHRASRSHCYTGFSCDGFQNWGSTKLNKLQFPLSFFAFFDG